MEPTSVLSDAKNHTRPQQDLEQGPFSYPELLETLRKTRT